MFKKHCGIARATYNWGLYESQKHYDLKGWFPSAIDLHKRLVSEIKVEKPYYYEVSSKTSQEALRNLEIGYKNSFEHGKELPKFKKKHNRDSFYLENYNIKGIRIIKNKIKLPKIGWIRMSETFVPTNPVKAVVISRQANDWFVSFKIEHSPIDTTKSKGTVGVDLGIKTLATLSDGTIFPSIKPFKKYKRKLKILQRKVSKKYIKGSKQKSNNYTKAQRKVAKLYKRISDVRKDYTHKITSYLAKNHDEIVIENLNIKGMSANHKLANAILDGGFYELRRQLEYKCNWYGSKLTIVNRFYPSSKLCSCCGNKKLDLKLSDRIYKCDVCNISLDRDLNASINLKNMAVGFTVSACGETNKC